MKARGKFAHALAESVINTIVAPSPCARRKRKRGEMNASSMNNLFLVFNAVVVTALAVYANEISPKKNARAIVWRWVLIAVVVEAVRSRLWRRGNSVTARKTAIVAALVFPILVLRALEQVVSSATFNDKVSVCIWLYLAELVYMWLDRGVEVDKYTRL